MTIKKYTYLFITLCFILTISLATLNYIVDPYILFQPQGIFGFNSKKPAAAARSRLSKPYNVIKVNPKTIVVGNSRPEMGLDPKSSCWPDQYGTVYSLTFPGAGFYAQVRALLHAVEGTNVENIVLAVDFSDFLYKRQYEKSFKKEIIWPKNNSEFFKRFLIDINGKENKNYYLNKVQDYTMTLFSLDTINDSIYTIMAQGNNVADRTELGFNPAKDYLEIIHFEGSWVLFEQKHGDLVKRFSKKGMTIYDSDQWSIELEALKRVVEMAERENIQLTIFINPYHYSYLEIIHDKGYWGEFKNFKKSLVDTVAKYGKGKVGLWDFSLYSEYTVTPIPKKGSELKKTSFFWEPAHYKKELGDLMLEDLFDTKCNKKQFNLVGINLNKAGIDFDKQDKIRVKLLNTM